MLNLIETLDRPVSFTTVNSSPDERVEPITLALTKKHIRFGSTTEDDLIADWIAGAREIFEEQANRQCIDAVWEFALERTPYQRFIELPRPPLVDVISITYDDENGDEQTMDPDSYRVVPSFLSVSPITIDPHCAPGRVELVTGAAWPIVSGQARALRIRRTCGYGATALDVPRAIKTVLYLLVGHFHRNRSEVSEPRGSSLQQLPLGAEALIKAFKWSALTVNPPKALCL